MPTYFFSYDEDGMTFFDNPHDCLDNTPRSIDCYVYIGPETKEWCKENPSDCRELHITDYLRQGLTADDDEYDQDDDWDSCAGFKYDEEDEEYILYMCGGCSEWWNYIITKNGVYREDRWGREKLDGVLYTDEEAYYVSLKDENYNLKNGESNVCEMVDECYFQ